MGRCPPLIRIGPGGDGGGAGVAAAFGMGYLFIATYDNSGKNQGTGKEQHKNKLTLRNKVHLYFLTPFEYKWGSINDNPYL